MVVSNLGSARGAKSSQGNRRGTCGWITSKKSILATVVLREDVLTFPSSF